MAGESSRELRPHGRPGDLGTPAGRGPRPAFPLLIAAAAGWAGTVVLARDMGGMTGMAGTMGLSLPGFAGTWTLMMVAMMLPSVVPAASLYASASRAGRISGLVTGYLFVWMVAGLPAYGLAWLGGRLATTHPAAARALTVAVFAACGLYQVSRFKDRCLAYCRFPLPRLTRHGSHRGPAHDVRAGIHHGAHCLGSCWGLMAVLVAVGVMNLVAMVALATLVLIEKAWARGPAAGRVAGAVALALALAAVWFPWLAPGLYAPPPMPYM